MASETIGEIMKETLENKGSTSEEFSSDDSIEFEEDRSDFTRQWSIDYIMDQYCEAVIFNNDAERLFEVIGKYTTSSCADWACMCRATFTNTKEDTELYGMRMTIFKEFMKFAKDAKCVSIRVYKDESDKIDGYMSFTVGNLSNQLEKRDQEKTQLKTDL